jgi:radical SAM protein with 4Fe4S-binding SPASM domain
LQEQALPYLSWVKFSVDAGTPETYRRIHRVSEKQFEVLMKNIYDSVQLKKQRGLDVTIGTQFLMTSLNSTEAEARSIVERLREIGPDYLSVKPYSDHPRSQKDLSVNPEVYDALEKTFNELRERAGFRIDFRRETIGRIQEGNAYPECYGLPFISLIDSKGDVLPCNLFYDMPEFTYGNLYQNSFSEIWGGDKRKEVLSKLKEGGVQDCRRGCRCDAGNRYLHRLKNLQLHDNFT